MRRRYAYLLTLVFSSLACFCRSGIVPEKVSVVPAAAANAPALKMGCLERGLIGSPDLTPDPEKRCRCDAPRLTKVTRAEAIAALRLVASRLGANVIWLRSEWLEQWQAVHCSDCAVSQYRVVAVAYSCDETTKASIPGE